MTVWVRPLRYLFPSPSPLGVSRGADLPAPPPTGLDALFQPRAWLTLLCHPILVTALRWHRILNRLSITYAFRPRLRPRLTLGGRPFPRNPWAFGGQDSHLPLRLLIPAFSLPAGPPLLSVRLRPCGNAPLPLRSSVVRQQSSGHYLGMLPVIDRAVSQ